MAWLLRLAARLPLPLLHAFGVVLGWMVYLGSSRYRKYLGENLALAGYRDPGIRRASIAEAGKGIAELPLLWLRSHGEASALVVEASGWESVVNALGGGGGAILLTPHLGCFEITAQYVARRYPITVLFSPPKLRQLEPLMRSGRDRALMKSVPPDMSGLRSMLRALHRGEAIGILPDQVPGVGEGEWEAFFGRPAYTMTLVGKLASKTGAPVVIGFAERLPRGRGFRLHAEALPAPEPGESFERRMNRAIEALVRRSPAQYLWAYNRYKVPAGAAPP
ncbi:MAG: hypothetical protein A3I00_05515 [Betaproteobacteria bacterium RIFCSPLOWO2_02_FULL_64_12]|nr:MAG: hypothetical protein A3I00_05515 [Betaproteobacteria bacterium RIFCSPLOWO2_02_FULL_64_12]